MQSYLATCISHHGMEKVKRHVPRHGGLRDRDGYSAGRPTLVILFLGDYHVYVNLPSCMVYLGRPRLSGRGGPWLSQWTTHIACARGFKVSGAVLYLLASHGFPFIRLKLMKYANTIRRCLVFYLFMNVECWTDCSQCV
jgi:hypothetical protein